MITTRNRLDELKRTLKLVSQLNPAPAEIMVTTDGCTDGTVEFLNEWEADLLVERGRREVEGGRKTEKRVIVNETARGSVASRDRMMREARGDLVLALDDDSYPEQMNCLEIIAKIFEERPHLAVASFPQRTEEYPATLKQTDFGPERPIRSFASSGACLRVAAYRSLPGFEPIFFHMYEEPDYALQCVANGWEVRFFPQVTIRHHWTGSGRSEIRNHHRHARNELWSTLMRCPMPQALGVVAYRIFSQARYAASRGFQWVWQEPFWWINSARGIHLIWKKRKPMTWKNYWRLVK